MPLNTSAPGFLKTIEFPRSATRPAAFCTHHGTALTIGGPCTGGSRNIPGTAPTPSC